MAIFLDKVLSALIMPISVAIALELVALGYVIARRRHQAALCLTLSLVTLWVFATPFMGRLLLRSLESQSTSVPSAGPADVAILLGGGMAKRSEALGELPSIRSPIDRARLAMQLYREGRVKFILITGGKLPWQQSVEPEAKLVARVLQDWGVPKEALLVEDKSRNTYENATLTKSIFDAHGFKTGVLVTSAFHIPRALAVFRRAGLDLMLAPADFRGGPLLEGGVFALLPDVAALESSTVAIREWIGIAVYKMRGWA